MRAVLLLQILVMILCARHVQSVACNSTVACAAGTQCVSNVCANCPIGKYKSASSTAACVDCFAHANATTTGQTTCRCLPGYENLGLFHVCTACPVGKYKGSIGNTNCTACSVTAIPHYSTATTASTTSSDCGCAPGYYAATAGGTACKACDQGSYTDAFRSTSCTNCSLDGYAAIGSAASSCDACPTGYTNNTHNTLCSIDVDECALGTDNCTDVCTNTVGGYTCSCLPGTTRELQDDGYTCLDPGHVGTTTTAASSGLLITLFALGGVGFAAAVLVGAKNMGSYATTKSMYSSGSSLGAPDFELGARSKQTGRYVSQG